MATVELKRLSEAVEAYRKDCGQYPDARSGLEALVNNTSAKGWKGPYLKEIWRDPWGGPWMYDASSQPPAIISFGADGQPGGSRYDTDLSSRGPSPMIPIDERAERARRTWKLKWAASLALFAVSSLTLLGVWRGLILRPAAHY
jgi:hypothetical protein